MNYQHALQVAGESLGLVTALLSFLGTVRNFLTHLNLLSADGSTKFGKVLDRAALVCEKGKKGLVWVASLPGFASRPANAPAPDLKVVPLLIVAALSLSGCATTGLPAGATFQQKVSADEAVLGAVKNDISAQCPKMAPVAGLISKALAVAMNPTDALSDITEALAAIPDLKQDYDAISCAIRVVLADYQKYFKAAPAAAPATKAENDMRNAAEMGQQVLLLLDQGATVTVASSADGGAEVSAYTP